MSNLLLNLEEFFSEDPNCEQIVQCLYSLNNLEFQIYCSLLFLEEADVSQIMDYTKRDDRVIVNRALQKLKEKNLCERKSTSQPGRRGYRYIYTPTPLIEIRENLIWKIENWFQSAIENLRNMESYFNEKHGIED